MGCGAVFSIHFGQQDEDGLRYASFVLIAALTLILNALSCLDYIQVFLHMLGEVWSIMWEYLAVIFYGITVTFLSNCFSSFLRATGNSIVPLGFLTVSSALNIVLNLWFVLGLERGTAGQRRQQS